MKWLQAFNTAGESTALADLNNGTGTVAGNFIPPVDGQIKKIAVFIGYEAATSLVEDVRVELEQANWAPNRLHFLAAGNGIRTAPAARQAVFEYDVDLEMKQQAPIVGQYIHDSGAPVTSRIRVLFGFE
jgi:hypothetical protein